MKTTLSLLSLLFIGTTVFAQSGSFDSDFSGDGWLTDSFDNDDDDGQCVLVQPDGKILVAGRAFIQGDYDFVVIRYNPDGSHDNTFSADGKASFNFGTSFEDFGVDMVLQSDGKIVVAGHTDHSGIDLALVRFNADGSVDGSFGNNGKTILDVGTIYDTMRAMDIGLTGKLIVTGSAWGDPFVAQFNTDGTPDNTFGTNGVVVTELPNAAGYLNDVQYQPDGKVLVVGTYAPNNEDGDFLVMRYNTDGSLDNTFSSDGIVNTDMAAGHDDGYNLHLHADGTITIVGTTQNNSALVRYNNNGTLDLSLNGLGKLQLSGTYNYSMRTMEVQPDGKYLLGGYYLDPTLANSFKVALMRVNHDGSFDTDFGTNGITQFRYNNNVDNSCNSIAIQPDLRIVITGGTGPYQALHDIATARFLSGLNLGMADLGQAGTIPLVYPNPVKETETLEYSLSKDQSVSIELLNINGQLIKSFIAEAARTAGPQKETLTLPSSLPSGTYIIRLKTNNGQQNVRVIKH